MARSGRHHPGRARRTHRCRVRTAQAAVDALDEHRLLCAHREGPYGVNGWNRQVERLVAERTGVTHYEEWYAGRPVLVTANDHGQGLYNGDIGVTIRAADGRLRVVVPGADGLKEFATTRLAGVQTVHAMTVHKSQGSQAGGQRDHAAGGLPPAHPRALLHRRDPRPGAAPSAPRSRRAAKAQRASASPAACRTADRPLGACSYFSPTPRR